MTTPQLNMLRISRGKLRRGKTVIAYAIFGQFFVRASYSMEATETMFGCLQTHRSEQMRLAIDLPEGHDG
jgi:hypothetical protein